MLTILQGDAIEQLRTLPSESVHCCVCSPPYWGLRDYGTAQWEGGDDNCDHLNPRETQRNDTATMYGPNSQQLSLKPFIDHCGKCGAKRIDSQLGLEKTPEEYVAKMVEVFREVLRVLRKDGTLWLNLGDSYSSGGRDFYDKSLISRTSGVHNNSAGIGRSTPSWAKPKDLLGIPWRVAFALQADGWWLRSDIIWAKPNPMPESVTDRPTKSHEYLFLFSKAQNYFYDAEAIKERQKDCSVERAKYPLGGFAKGELNDGRVNYVNNPNTVEQTRWNALNGSLANKRSVWTVATAPYPEAHFATYPPDLIKPCILAGTSAKGCCAKCGAPWERVVERSLSNTEGWGKATKDHHGNIQGSDAITRNGQGRAGDPRSKTIGWQPTCKHWDSTGREIERLIPCTVLDPFAGSGTTGEVAIELGRKAILIELNPKYVELIRQRCDVTPGLQLA